MIHVFPDKDVYFRGGLVEDIELESLSDDFESMRVTYKPCRGTVTFDRRDLGPGKLYGPSTTVWTRDPEEIAALRKQLDI